MNRKRGGLNVGKVVGGLLAIVETDDGDFTVGDQSLVGSILRIHRYPRAAHQLHPGDAAGQKQIVHHLGTFVVDVGIDEMDKRLILF